MEDIIRFVTLAQTDRFTMTDLCEQFGISRKTGYKHLERYAAGGLKALAARSHRPHKCPHRTSEAVEKLVVAERRLHRTRGPKKIQDVLRKKHGIEAPPARSTIVAPVSASPPVLTPIHLLESSPQRASLRAIRVPAGILSIVIPNNVVAAVTPPFR